MESFVSKFLPRMLTRVKVNNMNTAINEFGMNCEEMTRRELIGFCRLAQLGKLECSQTGRDLLDEECGFRGITYSDVMNEAGF